MVGTGFGAVGERSNRNLRRRVERRTFSSVMANRCPEKKSENKFLIFLCHKQHKFTDAVSRSGAERYESKRMAICRMFRQETIRIENQRVRIDTRIAMNCVNRDIQVYSRRYGIFPWKKNMICLLWVKFILTFTYQFSRLPLSFGWKGQHWDRASGTLWCSTPGISVDRGHYEYTIDRIHRKLETTHLWLDPVAHQNYALVIQMCAYSTSNVVLVAFDWLPYSRGTKT